MSAPVIPAGNADAREDGSRDLFVVSHPKHGTIRITDADCGLSVWVGGECRWQSWKERAPTPAPADGVPVRVAVVVSANGEYSGGGGSGQSDAEMLGWAREYFDGAPTAAYIFTATLQGPPQPQEIAATVEEPQP